MALLFSYQPSIILKTLDKVVDMLKKQAQKPKGKEKLKKSRQYFMRNGNDSSSSTNDSSIEVNLQQKLFYMIEQWLKFLSRPVLQEKEPNSEFCEKLLKFASNRIRRDHLLILKGLNQQVQNQQLHLIPPPLRGNLLSIWDEESNICS